MEMPPLTLHPVRKLGSTRRTLRIILGEVVTCFKTLSLLLSSLKQKLGRWILPTSLVVPLVPSYRWSLNTIFLLHVGLGLEWPSSLSSLQLLVSLHSSVIHCEGGTRRMVRP